MTTAALIVAAGRGLRAGGPAPKQYAPLCGKAVLRRAIERFAAHEGVDLVQVVIHPADGALYEAAVAGLDLAPPVPGGETRQQSVLNGLLALAPRLADPGDTVLIHDAARPFVSERLVGRVIGALLDAPAAIPALPVADAIKRAESGVIAATVDRQGLYRAQTPQGFRFRDILAAHRSASGLSLSDDAGVAENAGIAVRLVEGEEENFKITSAADLDRARRHILGEFSDVRVGQGFDVHRFAPGNAVWLCGVSVPHDKALAGHSDADVGLHALTDALLGAIAAGDIGQHFPPSDPRWRGANSTIFLRHAASLVAERGGIVGHVDVTIVCEKPRIGPHRAAMAERIASILGVTTSNVSVKATTTEGLGFTGREEGVAAMATATVRLKPAGY